VWWRLLQVILLQFDIRLFSHCLFPQLLNNTCHLPFIENIFLFDALSIVNSDLYL
jgi:hypothetical protein